MGAEDPSIALDLSPEKIAARQGALLPLLANAQELSERFEHIPPPSIPLTIDQFVACAQDVELAPYFRDLLDGCLELAGLDFDDPGALGAQVRKTASREVERVRELTDKATQIARLEVREPAVELRDALLALAHRGTEALIALLEAVTVTSPEEVRAAESKLQTAFGSIVAPAEELFGRLDELSEPDLNARIGLVLGRDGIYTDELGLIDPGLVFGAYAGEGALFAGLTERASAYFGHLLPEQSISAAEGAMLILPAVTLASLDRPLLAHNCGEQMASLVKAAHAADPDRSRQVYERTTNEGPRIFAASSRVQKGVRLLALAAQVEEIDEETGLRELMSAYKELAEAAFRSQGRAVLDLHALVEGKEISTEQRPPSFGALKQRLAASTSELARAMGAAADPDLRNASAHAQYRWDAEAMEAEDTESGRRWNVDELEERMESLVGAVVGIDAGYCCGAVACSLADRSPDWLARGEAPQVTELLSTALLAANGYRPVEFADRGATITLDGVDRADLSPLGAALGGLSMIVPDAESFRILDHETRDVLLDMPGDLLRLARDADPSLRDLAIVVAFCGANQRAGQERKTAVVECIALQAKVVSVSAMEDVVESQASPESAARIRARCERVREFALEDGRNCGSDIDRTVNRLERVIGETYKLERGDRRSLIRMQAQFDALVKWADRVDPVWPPTAS
jgi:hypothetical protein